MICIGKTKCTSEKGLLTISELPKASLSKRGLVHNHSYDNEFNLHVNEISFSYERMNTKLALRKRLMVIRKWPKSSKNKRLH